METAHGTRGQSKDKPDCRIMVPAHGASELPRAVELPNTGHWPPAGVQEKNQ